MLAVGVLATGVAGCGLKESAALRSAASLDVAVEQLSSKITVFSEALVASRMESHSWLVKVRVRYGEERLYPSDSVSCMCARKLNGSGSIDMMSEHLVFPASEGVC